MRSILAATFGAFVLVSFGGGACEAADRYLLPETATDLRAAFAADGPDGLSLKSARAGREKVSLVVCAGQAYCHRFSIVPADAGCTSPAGAWCVDPEEGDVPAALFDAVRARIAGVAVRFAEAASEDSSADGGKTGGDGASFRSDTERVRAEEAAAAMERAEAERIRREEADFERQKAEADRREQDPQFLQARAEDRLAVLAGVGTVVVPLLLGLLLGFAVRQGLGRRLRSTVLLALILVLPIAPWPFVPTATIRIGMWDLVLAGLCLGLGVAATLHERLRVELRTLALGTVSVLVATILLEGATRLLLPMPPACPPPRSAALVLVRALNLPNGHPMFEEGLFPPDFPRLLGYRMKGRNPDRKVVLHVGDSMVHGAGVRSVEAFPERLDGLDPGIGHMNGGVSGAAFDYYYLLTRTWVRQVPTVLVVWHVFGNDQTETDAPYALCANGPLLRWEAGRPVPLCPDAPVRDDAAGRPWVISPAPYVLRVLTGHSFLARHLFSVVWRLQGGMNDAVSMETKAAHAEALVATMRDELKALGIPFLLTALPARGDLGERGEADLASAYERNRFVSGIAERQGVPFLDSLDYFLGEVRRDGAETIFLVEPAGDPHLNPEGHARYARWLLDRLYTVPGLGLSR